MNEALNCPNCGAPVEGEKCAYCGTVIYDFAVIDDSKYSYIKMRLNGHLLMFKVLLRSADITMEPAENYIYLDNKKMLIESVPQMTITTEFTVIPDDDILYKVKKEKKEKQI